MRFDFPVAFLDIDGVLNRLSDDQGNPDPFHIYAMNPEKYGICQPLVDRFVRFARENSVKAILTTNWRKYPEFATFKGKEYRNPIGKTIEALGDVYYFTMPADRHVSKSEQLMLFEEDNGILESPFVIFDDMDEGYGGHPRYSSHFVRTDLVHGLTEADLEKARRIIST